MATDTTGTEALEILAIEPFYCGARRLMLESLARRSRHRWTILRLPGRRIERRLEAAAQWFAEVILRRPLMNFDVLFTSEAINLPELFQLCPEVSGHPTVVYFHDNQLPIPGRAVGRPIDPVNLLTALEATECWFNSLHHLRSFSGRAMAVVRQLPQYFSPDALAVITEKCALVPPPVESLVPAGESGGGGGGGAVPLQRVFVDLRQADTALLSDALAELERRGEAVELVTIGPRGELSNAFPRQALAEHDEEGATAAMAGCGTYLSTQTDAAFDPRAIMALAAGIRTALPVSGSFQDLIPDGAKGAVLYQPRPQFLASMLQELWSADGAAHPTAELQAAMSRYSAEVAVHEIDDRLSHLHATRPQPA